MDVRCPECDRLFENVDFSLATSKFGCSCGHKFFLNELENEPSDKDPIDEFDKENSKDQEKSESSKETDHKERDDVRKDHSKSKGNYDEDIDDSDDTLSETDRANQRTAARNSRQKKIGLILNIILVALIISACVLCYLGFTGKIKPPFEIRIQMKEPAGEQQLVTPEDQR